MRSMLNGTVIAYVGCMLSACAAALPGHVPEGGKRSAVDRIKPFESGQVADNGIYQPSPAERDLTCGKLRGSMAVILARLKAAQKPDPSVAAAAAQTIAAGIRGKALILPPTEENRRDRARLDAYNRLLTEKNCPTVDIAAELTAQPSRPPAPSSAKKP